MTSPAASPTPPAAATPAPLRSTHTDTFPQVLAEVGASVLVTTYQAGKLVVLREDGGVLNTHFRGFNRPMGLAVRGGRLAIGTALEIWEYHDAPAVARKLPPAGKHDACFLPRTSHVTGDVLIHEMDWAGDELVFVNTRFSCLCVRDPRFSFRPVWKPPFVTAYTPDDRCHLNGLGVRDGVVRYVTALGQTDAGGEWRQNKRSGGVLLDVPSGEVIAAGLSMPHSPRWHAGRLWLLDSGTGSLGTVDEATGRYEPVIELPGFTRGIDFAGPYAFVGLSQVRETAVFSGIPLVERLQERACGVCAVDLRTGRLVGWVKFEDALQEIFAVQALPGRRFPDVINDNTELVSKSYVLPDDALGSVPESLFEPGPGGRAVFPTPSRGAAAEA